MQRMCGMQPELAGGISFDDAVDAIEEVTPIKNNAKETFVNATGGNGDNAVGGNLSYQRASKPKWWHPGYVDDLKQIHKYY